MDSTYTSTFEWPRLAISRVTFENRHTWIRLILELGNACRAEKSIPAFKLGDLTINNECAWALGHNTIEKNCEISPILIPMVSYYILLLRVFYMSAILVGMSPDGLYHHSVWKATSLLQIVYNFGNGSFIWYITHFADLLHHTRNS